MTELTQKKGRLRKGMGGPLVKRRGLEISERYLQGGKRRLPTEEQSSRNGDGKSLFPTPTASEENHPEAHENPRPKE